MVEEAEGVGVVRSEDRLSPGVTWLSLSAPTMKRFTPSAGLVVRRGARRMPIFRIALFALSVVLPAAGADNLALLSGTLRTYQRAGCEGEVVTLRCPQSTTISVQVAQYGRPPPSSPQHHSIASTTLYRPPPLCPGHAVASPKANATCHWPNALQYSLLQTVVEICQKKRQCKFQVTAKELSGGAAVDDICPGSSKFVEVAYKCSPFEFRSKVACEDQSTELRCDPHTRIAIYSASFGRTEYESIKCPQPQGVPEETCLVSYATETAMQQCHGRRRCVLHANSATFGNPCRDRSQTYLKVIYTCVPRKVLVQVLQEREEDEAEEEEEEEEDEEGAGGGNDDYEEAYGGGTDDLFRESSAFSPAPNADGDSGFGGGPGKAQPSLVGKSAPGGGGPTPRQHSETSNTSSANGNNIFLYVFLGLGGCLVVLLSVLAGRFYLGRRKEGTRKKKASGEASSSSSAHSPSPSAAGGEAPAPAEPMTTLPNGFLASKVEMMTEIDTGIDLMVASPGRRYLGAGGRGVIATTSAGVPLPPPAAQGPLTAGGQVLCYGHPRGGGSVLGVRFQCGEEGDPGGNNQYYYS